MMVKRLVFKVSFAAFVIIAATMVTSCQEQLKKIKGSIEETIAEESEEVEIDTVKPTITAYSKEVNVGQNPDYLKDVEAEKNGEKLKVKVDSSAVNIYKEGDYPVIYTAADSNGVKGSKTVTVRVNNPRHKVVYLTFDDGPSSTTGKILKILKDNEVNATFFVTAQDPNHLHYIKQAYEDGNAIAAHTYSHNFSIYKNLDTYFADLDKINDVIEKQTGHRTQIIRFPGGSSNHVFAKYNDDPYFMINLAQEVQKRGYQYVDWNADSRDASCVHPTQELVTRSACRASGPQLCLLMHDVPAKQGTVAALPAIITFFKEQGYEFGTITSTGYMCHHNPAPFSHKKKASTQTPANADSASTTASPASKSATSASTSLSSASSSVHSIVKKNSTRTSANAATTTTTAETPANNEQKTEVAPKDSAK